MLMAGRHITERTPTLTGGRSPPLRDPGRLCNATTATTPADLRSPASRSSDDQVPAPPRR